MKQRWFILFFCLVGPLTAVTLLLTYPHPAAAGSPLSRPLAQAMATTPSNQAIDIIIHLALQADLQLSSLPTERLARRQTVVERLQQTAVASQTSLRRQLDVWQEAGLIHSYQPLWIINAIVASANPPAIAQLASRPDVVQITLDEKKRLFEPPPMPLPSRQSPTPSAPPWGIERIGAPYVWHGLGVEGDGVTMAILDSGVDWLHPLLWPNYRGNLGNGQVNHAGSWFSPGNPALTEPTDLFGHGTHVAGTAVAQQGVGVAPGARWIAANITDANGWISNSAVHRAFEWLLAPNGNPALAPDIVNGSWGDDSNPNTYQADIQALLAADILPVFAVGNSGPRPETIGAPAGYANVIAVGSSDDLDHLAWFSSRGPSGWTSDHKPTLVAPGTSILSTLPGGHYGFNTGTSMATPHIAGALALLLSANPTLLPKEALNLLKTTAVAIDPPHPNDNSGWGRVDVYAAVQPQVTTGQLTGQVRGGAMPLPHAPLTVSNSSGELFYLASDADGAFTLALRPGSYQLETAYFGYAKAQPQQITVVAQQTAVANFSLTPLPTGEIRGQVADQQTSQPLLATIEVVGTPVKGQTEANGRYTLHLPAGAYQLLVRTGGHRLGSASHTLAAGQTIIQDFALPSAPNLLLIDSGQWYYDSVISYYQEALDTIGYVYDLWPVRDPFGDVPTLDDLRPYDAIIWSAPHDSIGAISAGSVITDYLDGGGKLLISGEEVARRDGFGFSTQVWFYRDLAARFIGETISPTAVTGQANTPFAGLHLILNGPASAGNQFAPDETTPRALALTQPIFQYDNGRWAGLQAGHCRRYQIIYLGFGLEGVSEAANRATLLDRSLTQFQTPEPQFGLRFAPTAVDDFALAGERLVYTLTLRNLSETITETYQLQTSGATWPNSLLTPTLTLPPCSSGQTVLTLDVPPDVPDDVYYTMQLTAVAQQNPANSGQLTLRHKTPASILLVDDDRWYNQEKTFQAALDANQLSYDTWEIGWSQNVRGSPPLRLLQAYDMVLWFTGYDWFAPITPEENGILTAYVAGNGRLFLNSQDYLYYHLHTPLALNYFGVLSQTESMTPTLVYASDQLGLPDSLAGPLPLDYEQVSYQNFSDQLIAAPGSQPFLWHNQGTPAGLANAGPHWRTLFWDVPLEVLPASLQATALNSIVGWLSDLGESSLTVDQRSGPPNEPRVYTITVQNFRGGVQNQVTLTNTLPLGLTLLPPTLNGGATYDPATRQVRWQGALAAGQAQQIRYQAIPTGPPGELLANEAIFFYERHGLTVTRSAPLWVMAPNLARSQLTAVTSSPTPPTSTGYLTYTLRLENGGQGATQGATAVVRLPNAANPLTPTLTASSGTAELVKKRIKWQGDLEIGQQITVSLVLTYTPRSNIWLPATAVVQDGITNPIIRHTLQTIAPYHLYFPSIYARHSRP